MTALPDHFWEDLLMYIEEGQVIPIVGKELLTVGDTRLYHVLAERLAKDLKIAPESLPNDFSIDHVVGAYRPFQEKRPLLYPRLKTLLDAYPVPTPQPLLQLARIRPLRLFVTTTFDSLLTQALNEVRYASEPKTRVLFSSLNRVGDLDPEGASDNDTVVFHLFGKVSASPDYAATESDTLEFIHGLQTREGRPQRLFDELHHKHLLMIGTGFPDWLARFFLRVAKCDRLWIQREKTEILADECIQKDERLDFFLNHFSRESTVFTDGGPVEFVNKLYEKWIERNGSQTVPNPTAVHEDFEVSASDTELGHIFLSYAREDYAAASRLQQRLEAAGLDVWLDQRELRAGDAYEDMIRRHIRKCPVFVPLISKNTNDGQPRFVRKEWHWAIQRLPEFTGTTCPFILPVMIDEVRIDDARVPDEFRAVQTTDAPAGEPPPTFIEQLRQIIRDVRKRERVAA